MKIDNVVELNPETKNCTVCNEIKDISKFGIRTNGKYMSQCKECHNEQGRSNYKKDLEKSREYSRNYGTLPEQKLKASNRHLIKKYGITLDQKQEMLNNQNNTCALCPYNFKDLADANVDHNHDTKKIRELLCHNCNVAIGLLKEDKQRIENLRFYLAKHDDNYTDLSKFAAYLKEREGVDLLETKEGYATYTISEQECWIKDIYVIPEYRNKHVASNIANKIANKAKQLGCKKLYGTVCPSAEGSTVSIKVLLAYGFKVNSSVSNLIAFVKDLGV